MFELIWIDGGHDFPVVAWDTMFAYNRLKEGGFIFMHDYAAGDDVSKVHSHVSDIIVDETGLLPERKSHIKNKVAWIRRQQEACG